MVLALERETGRQSQTRNCRRSASGSGSVIPARRGHVKIYECGDKLCGKLVWSSKPESRDINNPDESKRDKILIGQDILTGLQPDGENFWDYGRLYDATTGKTWNCNIEVLPGNDKLRIRGYWGISLSGQSRVWTRVK